MSVIEMAEKLHELVTKAPAGGVFHDLEIGTVEGAEFSSLGVATFTLTSKTGVVYDVGVVRQGEA